MAEHWDVMWAACWKGVPSAGRPAASSAEMTVLRTAAWSVCSWAVKWATKWAVWRASWLAVDSAVHWGSWLAESWDDLKAVQMDAGTAARSE